MRGPRPADSNPARLVSFSHHRPTAATNPAPPPAWRLPAGVNWEGVQGHVLPRETDKSGREPRRLFTVVEFMMRDSRVRGPRAAPRSQRPWHHPPPQRPGRPVRLLRARLAAPGSPALPGRGGPPHPATAW